MLNPGKALTSISFVSLGLVRGVHFKYFMKAAYCRMQSGSVFFDPSTGITSVILGNTDFIGPPITSCIIEVLQEKFYKRNTRKKTGEKYYREKLVSTKKFDLPLIVVNIPPVLNENGQQAILKDVSSVISLILKS